MIADPEREVQGDTAAQPSDDGRSLGEAMADARPTESAGLVLAHARVAGALFGADTRAKFGRYRILERLGAGGMGVVHAAYDPELDRGVALKLVRVPANGRDAALAEAKALARLAHENVVRVFDVGIEGDYVYLVMELVRGVTLRAWVRGRDRADVIGAYRQAGAALAAAHAAGLVHRDFKPENALVGVDGTVRVVDFGLACEADGGGEHPQPPAGTPRYMAPEQTARAPITPAADQYSFCVALAEALAASDAQPLPRWLAVVTERGCAVEPGDRFASMDELLRWLGRDPARSLRRRAAAVAIAAVVAIGAFLIGRIHAATSEIERCTGGEVELAIVWPPTARAMALARLDSLGAYGRSIRPQIEAALAEHAQRWIAGRRGACTDHLRGLLSDALFDRRTACLERSRNALAAVADILAHTDTPTLAEVPRAVATLPDSAACADAQVLLSDVDPPAAAIAPRVAQLQARLDGTRARLRAGRYADARALAMAVVAEARSLDHAPLLAEALLIAGHAAMQDDREAAVPMLAEATTLALASHADALAVEAWARRAWAEGTTSNPAGALAGLDVIEVLAKRTPSAQFARALLDNNVGGIELARDHRARARAAFQRALAGSSMLTGPEALELANARVNLAIVTDAREAADKLLEEAIAILSRALGEDHPDVLEVRWIRGTMTIERLPDAIAYLTRVCRGLELHAGLDTRIGECWAEVGYLQAERGERGAAIASLERGLARFEARNAPTEASGLLELLRGNLRAASKRCADAVAAVPAPPEHGWWLRLARGMDNVCWGRSLRSLGDLPRARSALENGIADLTAVVLNHPSTAYEFRLGRARVELAFTLAAMQVDAKPATLSSAHHWLERIDADPREIADLARLH